MLTRALGVIPTRSCSIITLASENSLIQAAFQISTNVKYDYPTRVRANFVTRKLFTSVKVSALSVVSVTKVCLVYYFQIKLVVFEHEFGAQFRSLEQYQSVRSSITIEIRLKS